MSGILCEFEAVRTASRDRDAPRRHETLEEIVAVGWMSDFHPFNKDLVADPSPKILVIVDSCVEIKILRRVRLLDGVAMPVPHRSTEPALVDFHTGR